MNRLKTEKEIEQDVEEAWSFECQGCYDRFHSGDWGFKSKKEFAKYLYESEGIRMTELDNMVGLFCRECQKDQYA